MSDVSFIPRSKAFEQFLRFTFNSPTGDIRVNRKHDLGKLMISRVRYAEKPVNNEGVGIVFPDVKSVKKHWCYYTSEDMHLINDAISSFLTLDLVNFVLEKRATLDMLYYLAERRAKGKERNELFVEYILDRGFEMDGQIYDMLKKREYRFRASAYKKSEDNEQKSKHR